MKLLSTPLLFALAAPAASQVLTFTPIVGPNDPVRSHGHSPALDGDLVAFLGSDKTTNDTGIYVAAADGSGPYTVIVDDETPLPNVPGETFRFLDNPEIHQGVVTFTAGHELFSSTNDGIYQGSGGPVSVYFDHWNDLLGTPNPFAPLVEAGGVLFQSASADQSQFLDFSQPYFSVTPGSYVLAASGPLPGGGGLFHLTSSGDSLALGGGQIAFSADVSAPSGFQSGVYTRGTDGSPIDLVANWKTPMPGKPFPFENFWEVDTDGAQVVFVGQSGLISFGGHQGIYLAPVGAAGAGPITTLVELGDLDPSGREYLSFDRVAVEGELVIFGAIIPGAYGIYGAQGGQVFEILDSTDQLDGVQLGDVDFDFRGLDQGRLAVRVLYPITGGGLFPYGLYVVSIVDPVCQPDLGFGGPGSAVLSVCGEELSAGGTAEPVSYTHLTLPTIYSV